jgi:hypothetical protein
MASLGRFLEEIWKNAKDDPKTGVLYAVILIAGLIVLYVLGAMLIWVKRQWSLMRTAKALGFTYNWYDRWQIPTKCSFLPLFSKSTGGKVGAIVHGSREGVEIYVFNFRRRPDWGPSRIFRWWTTVVVFEMSYNFPFFYLRKEEFSDKLAAMIGHDDIDDFKNKGFNREFYVKAADRDFAHDLMTDEMVEFVMSHVGKENINIEMSRAVMAFHLDKVTSSKKTKWLHDLGWEFWEKTPEQAVSRQRG